MCACSVECAGSLCPARQGGSRGEISAYHQGSPYLAPWRVVSILVSDCSRVVASHDNSLSGQVVRDISVAGGHSVGLATYLPIDLLTDLPAYLSACA